MEVFPATLGTRERLITYGVGYGVGIGVPLALGMSFALGFGEPLLLLFPLPFVIAFGLPYFFRPTGFGVTTDGISILRPVGPKRIPLREIRQAVSPATGSQGPGIGLARLRESMAASEPTGAGPGVVIEPMSRTTARWSNCDSWTILACSFLPTILRRSFEPFALLRQNRVQGLPSMAPDKRLKPRCHGPSLPACVTFSGGDSGRFSSVVSP